MYACRGGHSYTTGPNVDEILDESPPSRKLPELASPDTTGVQ